MSGSIAIVDYGLGNLGSVKNMLRKLGASSVITAQPEELVQATALILPGVGHFDTGMKNLRSRGLEAVLSTQVLEKKVPILGICLGVQLFARRSEEGAEPGLGWIAADVKRFTFPGGPQLPVPHMGWNEVEWTDSKLLEGATRGETRFYFVHSYHVVPDDPEDVAATATYGRRFVAAVTRGNIMGAQFHPEKSHRFGMALLRNWLKLAGHAP
ncbi:MAG: imidazole glycerol phosphate synthase subunit HisH [Archangium sp.]|nr:imidazole glycerol phosphate synthase subunit HisH [Archangium sp.]